MAEQVRIGFVNAGSGGGSTHMQLFQSIIPGEVVWDPQGLGLLDESTENFEIRYQVRDYGPLIEKTNAVAAERGWDGVIMAAAPLEVMNPGLAERLDKDVNVPVTTALNDGTSALKAFGAKRVLLMTPFTERMNARIRENLGRRGVDARTFGEFETHTQAMKLGPEEVRQRARAALDQAGEVDAIYFQGAVLDPVPVIETLEQDAEMPVVASNPAMLWYILSKLGRRYSVAGYGKLLEQWPGAPN